MSKNKAGDTVIHLIIANHESLKLILDKLPIEVIIDLIKEGSKNDSSALLYKALRYPESLRHILKKIQDKDIIQNIFLSIEKKDSDRIDILFKAIKKPESLKQILDYFTINYILKDINENNIFLLHEAVWEPESLKLILNKIIEKENIFIDIKRKNDFGHTILDIAIEVPESLIQIFEVVPKKDRLQLAEEKIETSTSVLEEINSNPIYTQSMREILLNLIYGVSETNKKPQ